MPDNQARRRSNWRAIVRSWLTPGHAGLALSCLIIWMAFFQSLRVLLLVINRDLVGEAAWGNVLESFLIGLRFDLSMSAYLLLPLLSFCTIAGCIWGKAAHSHLLWYGSLLSGSALALLGVAEVEFYREFYTRYNSLAFHYWSQPGTVMSMIWHGFPVIRYALLAAALLAGLMLAVRRALVFWACDAASLRLTRKNAVATALLTALFVIAARGGIRGSPLEWGDAVHCESTFANHLAHNGLWMLSRAALDLAHDQRALAWPEPMPLSEADSRVAEMLRPASERSLPAVGSAGNRPNVVVIIMESFTARYVGACGSEDDYTPEFNALAKQGVLFDRCFSSGTHTHQANVAVLGGMPNLPRHEALMEDYALGSQPLPALPRLLKQQGYSTSYLYNGDFAWENMRGFFQTQGIDRFIGRHDFDSRGYFDSTWGVSDQVLFDRANQEFRQARAPFFSAILTLSNHAPFKLPQPLPFEPTTSEGAQNQRINAMRYADWALGRFFEQARREAYFKNTLFVLVGDHGFSIAPILTELRLLRFHVPLLFYAPHLLGAEGRSIRTVASQNDVIPTVLGLMGQQSLYRHWGRDLFALPRHDPGLAYFKPSESSDEMGFARGDLLLVRSADGQFHGYRYSLADHATVEKVALNKHPDLQAMQRDAQAYVTAAAAALEQRRAAGVAEITMETNADLNATP